MDGLECRWEEISVNIEGNVTSVWYQNPIAAVKYIHNIPHLRTISCTRQSNKLIPVANVYTLRC
jgi:hypothetical protein